jgi:hypothetical protein
MDWFDIFNTRETALLIWLVLLSPVALWFSTTRGILFGLFKTFMRATALHQYLLITLVWVALEVWILEAAGLWSLAHLKGTIIWVLAVPMVTTWRMFQRPEKERFVFNALRDTFALTVLVEFVVDFYPLALWVEFLLMPIAAGLTLFHETGKQQEGAEPATSLFEWLLAALGLFVLAHAALSAIADIHTLFSSATLAELIGPIALTTLFLPYLFAVAVFVTYANAFQRITVAIEDKELRKYAHFHSTLAFGWRLEMLRRWSRDVGAGFADSRQDVRRSILEVLEARKRERNPPKIAQEEGWSPNIARHFLDEVGLSTNDYHRAAYTTDQWFCGSNYLELDDEALPNNIAYYVDGDAEIARQLKLVLNVNNSASAEAAISTLLNLATHLAEDALGKSLPETSQTAIISKTDNYVTLQGKQVIVEFEPFVSDRGFTIRFVIRLPDWNNAATGQLRMDREKDRAKTDSQ